MATPPTRPTLRLPVHATVDKVETWARLAPATARYHRAKLEAALAAIEKEKDIILEKDLVRKLVAYGLLAAPPEDTT